MVNAILNGCNGAMGRVITDIVSKDDGIRIVAGVDVNPLKLADYEVYETLDQCPAADVVIDFSSAKATDGVVAYCEKTKTPVVLCTTGLSEEQLERVKALGETTAVLRSANMSLGVNLLFKILKQAAPVLAEAGFDIEILEKHHNQKVDAPSGTALALADAVNESLGNEYHYKNALNDKPLPVYGKGENVRDWLYVEDHCKAIDLIIHNGRVGEVYNIGGHNEMKNIDIVKIICKELGKPESLITYVEDRKGHDMRYAIDPTKIHNELGWLPETMFKDGIKKTIQWYLDNKEWWETIISGEYQNYYEKMYAHRQEVK